MTPGDSGIVRLYDEMSLVTAKLVVVKNAQIEAGSAKLNGVEAALESARLDRTAAVFFITVWVMAAIGALAIAASLISKQFGKKKSASPES